MDRKYVEKLQLNSLNFLDFFFFLFWLVYLPHFIRMKYACLTFCLHKETKWMKRNGKKSQRSRAHTRHKSEQRLARVNKNWTQTQQRITNHRRYEKFTVKQNQFISEYDRKKKREADRYKSPEINCSLAKNEWVWVSKQNRLLHDDICEYFCVGFFIFFFSLILSPEYFNRWYGRHELFSFF